MKNNFKKYIVYVNNDYLRLLFDAMGAETAAERIEIKEGVFRKCIDLINAESNTVVMFDSFMDPKGNLLKSVEIIPFPISKKPNTLSYLKASKKKRKR